MLLCCAVACTPAPSVWQALPQRCKQVLSVLLPKGRRLLPAARTLLCSAPRCAAAKIMFSTLRALSGFTRAMRDTAGRELTKHIQHTRKRM